MSRQIPRNRDQGEEKDRVSIIGNNLLGSLHELKSRTDKPVYVVPSDDLFQVPGVVKDRVQAEPAETARLDNIENMVESLTKGFSGLLSRSMEQQFRHQGAGIGARHKTTLPAANRGRSPSVERPAETAQLDTDEPIQQQMHWSDIVRKNQR